MRDSDACPRPGPPPAGAATSRPPRVGARGACAGVSGACVIAGVVLAAACGPSPRRVHYGDRFFERCAAADAAGERPAQARQRCWSDWLSHYRSGQPPERIAWATERIAALRDGDASPTVPELHADGLTATPATPANDDRDATAPGPPPWDRSPPTPAAERVGVCAEACTPDWEACTAACEAEAADCRRACDAEFQVCVRACP